MIEKHMTLDESFGENLYFVGLCSRHENCFKSPLNCLLTMTQLSYTYMTVPHEQNRPKQSSKTWKLG